MKNKEPIIENPQADAYAAYAQKHLGPITSVDQFIQRMGWGMEMRLLPEEKRTHLRKVVQMMLENQ